MTEISKYLSTTSMNVSEKSVVSVAPNPPQPLATITRTDTELGQDTKESTVTLSPEAIHLAKAHAATERPASIAEKPSEKSDGYSTMLERIFRVSSKDQEPAVAKAATVAAANNRDFLTSADRQYLATAYQFAQANGSDLSQVDYLAVDLSHYRFLQATGNNIETRPGIQWNTDGSPHYWKMSDQDSVTATRILNSQAAATTSMDQGFIAYLLNPRGAGWTNETDKGHITDFGFLEKMIQATASNPTGSVNENEINPSYRNSLNWIGRQDEPDLPPEGHARESEADSLSALNSSLTSTDPDIEFFQNALKMLRSWTPKAALSDDDMSLPRKLVGQRAPQATIDSVLMELLNQRTSNK